MDRMDKQDTNGRYAKCLFGTWIFAIIYVACWLYMRGYVAERQIQYFLNCLGPQGTQYKINYLWSFDPQEGWIWDPMQGSAPASDGGLSAEEQ